MINPAPSALADLILPLISQHPPTQTIYLGYSGGVDSHVLLHLCAAYRQQADFVAVYIHHGLLVEADAWAEHGRQTAAQLGLAFQTIRVNAKPARGESPEEAARNARYAAFKSLLAPGDALLLAQHSEDQLETVLLQLFRGAGLKGLSGMSAQIAFGEGMLYRPLLTVSKQTILDYAQAEKLVWVEDPSNQCNDYDRNFLRNNVLPLLKLRWPGVAKTVSRAAGHAAQAQDLLNELAGQLLPEVSSPNDKALSIPRLLELPLPKQRLVIRQWFQHQGLRMPAEAVIDRLFSEVIAARPEREPVLAGKGYTLRRYRDCLYLLDNASSASPTDSHWPAGQKAVPVAGGRWLELQEAAEGILKSQWQSADIMVRYRQGGEKIRLPSREGQHLLKKLYQEAGIPPWQRAEVPLIYLDERLAAVGDYWISADFYHANGGECVSLALKPTASG